VGTGFTLFSGGLFWRLLRFGRNWLLIIFWQIFLEAVQIWRELAPHYFLVDCFFEVAQIWWELAQLFSGGLFWRQLDLAGTGSTLFSGGLFWRPLRFGGNWLVIIFRRIIFFEAAQIWRELAPHYFLADCFVHFSKYVIW
jgi:hypothetical protein